MKRNVMEICVIEGLWKACGERRMMMTCGYTSGGGWRV